MVDRISFAGLAPSQIAPVMGTLGVGSTQCILPGTPYYSPRFWYEIPRPNHVICLAHLAVASPCAPGSLTHSAQVTCSFCSSRFPICPPLRLCYPWGQEHSPHLCSALLPGTTLYFVPLSYLSPLEILCLVHLHLFIHLPLAPCHEACSLSLGGCLPYTSPMPGM